MHLLHSQMAVQVDSLNVFSSMVRMNFSRHFQNVSKVGWYFSQMLLRAGTSPVYPFNKRPSAIAAASSVMEHLLAVAATVALVSGSMTDPTLTRMWATLVTTVLVLLCTCMTLRADIAIGGARRGASRSGHCACDGSELALAFVPSMAKKGALVSCRRFAGAKDSWPDPEMIDDSNSTPAATGSRR